MKSLKFFLFLIFFGMFIAACGDDDPNDGNVDCNDSFSINAELADETNAITAAVNAYSVDQSAANCNALKAAYQNYFNAAMALQDCANQVGQGAEFQAALQGAQDSIDALVC
jgi:hypothetical protein